MRKAKFVLAAFAILAIGGGILAFKAKGTYQGNLRCSFSAGITCPLVTYTTTSNGTLMWCTLRNAPLSAPCVPMTVTWHP
jgi:hypothetical protein